MQALGLAPGIICEMECQSSLVWVRGRYRFFDRGDALGGAVMAEGPVEQFNVL
jgi:hypothetical protein